jgi:hypothetical protein
MKEKDEIFSKLEIFFLGMVVGSIVGNALVYLFIESFI